MGFFSDLKEDLSHAVNELVPEDEKIRTGEETAQQPSGSLGKMLKNIDDGRLPEGEDVKAAEAKQPDSAADRVRPETAHSEEDMEKLLATMLEESPDSKPQEDITKETADEESKGAEEKMEFENSRVAADETSVITEGMTITGDIMTQGSIDVVGTVNGNIDALGKLNITGHVNGNSKAAEIYAESAKINGEIVSEGAVKIGASSVIIGNISARLLPVLSRETLMSRDRLFWMRLLLSWEISSQSQCRSTMVPSLKVYARSAMQRSARPYSLTIISPMWRIRQNQNKEI